MVMRRRWIWAALAVIFAAAVASTGTVSWRRPRRRPVEFEFASRAMVASTISTHDVVIFCFNSESPQCKIIEDTFKEFELKEEPCVIHMVDQDHDSLKIIVTTLLKFTGQPGVPQVFVHGKHLHQYEIYNIITARDTHPQLFVRGKRMGQGALTILLRLAKAENWMNFREDF